MIVRFLYTNFFGFPYGAWIASIIYMVAAVEFASGYEGNLMKYLGFGTVPVFWMAIGAMHLLRRRLRVDQAKD